MPSPAPPELTDRERDVLRLVAAGQANRQIAAHLGIGEATVKAHLREAFARLNAVEILPEEMFRGVGDPRWSESAAGGPRR